MLGFNIDSIILFKRWEQLIKFDFQALGKLINARKIQAGKFKNWMSGSYKNIRIKYNSDYGIYIMGSISNYYVGYNLNLKHSELEKAIERLGLELNIDLHSARLYRADLALNIETNKPINYYTNHLFTDLPKFKRFEQADGVRFESKEIKIAIYNKSKELLEKRNIKIKQDILRIELRLMRGLSDRLMIKEVQMQDLYSNISYKLLISIFQKYYNKIKKQTILDDLENVTYVTPTLLSDYMKRNAIDNTFGGEDKAYYFIEQLSLLGKFKTANDKSRCRKMIKKLSENIVITRLHPLIEEINYKVLQECLSTK